MSRPTVVKALRQIEARATAVFPTDDHKYGSVEVLAQRVMLPLAGFDLELMDVLEAVTEIVAGDLDPTGAFMAGLATGLRLAELRAKEAST